MVHGRVIHMPCSHTSALVQARQQLKEMVWMKSSENMVLEAMFRLSGLHDALEELLRPPVVPSGPSRYLTGAP